MPGTSNHEGGNAIDIPTTSLPKFKKILLENGWKRLHNWLKDPVHFEFGENSSSLAKLQLLAF